MHTASVTLICTLTIRPVCVFCTSNHFLVAISFSLDFKRFFFWIVIYFSLHACTSINWFIHWILSILVFWWMYAEKIKWLNTKQKKWKMPTMFVFSVWDRKVFVHSNTIYFIVFIYMLNSNEYVRFFDEDYCQKKEQNQCDWFVMPPKRSNIQFEWRDEQHRNRIKLLRIFGFQSKYVIVFISNTLESFDFRHTYTHTIKTPNKSWLCKWWLIRMKWNREWEFSERIILQFNVPKVSITHGNETQHARFVLMACISRLLISNNTWN